ncbi:hypothetical protein M5689_014890 [Euphorbia peplus]|nr:hypothetical protein M5689_014890 [Euphorbia peplus]
MYDALRLPAIQDFSAIKPSPIITYSGYVAARMEHLSNDRSGILYFQCTLLQNGGEIASCRAPPFLASLQTWRNHDQKQMQ